MHKKLFALLLLLTMSTSFCFGGTMIYRNREGKESIVTRVKIISIDTKYITFRIGSGTEVMPLSNLIKYYDTDIRGEIYEDSTADYEIRLGEIKSPNYGSKKSGKRSEVNEFTAKYRITRNPGEPQRGAVRQPYFYLFVLTATGTGQRNFYSYSFPDAARVTMRSYDEASMFTKAIDLNRPLFHPDDASRLGSSTSPKDFQSFGGEYIARFPLSRIGDEEIIAWYLVGWSKSKIVVEKEEKNNFLNIRSQWWIR